MPGCLMFQIPAKGKDVMGRFTPQEGCLTHRWIPEAQPAALTRMLGSSTECRARTIASSETRVSPLVWISSTAIWGRRSAEEVQPCLHAAKPWVSP